jgi:hypothetical protein
MAAKGDRRVERLPVQGREIAGRFRLALTQGIDFRDGVVHVRAEEMFVVPKEIEQKPYGENEVKLLLIEPRGVANTGDAGGERTAEQDVWI